MPTIFDRKFKRLESTWVTVYTGGPEQTFLPDGEKCDVTVKSDGAGFSSNKAIFMKALTRTVNDFIVDQFSRLSEVTYISAIQNGDVYYIWVALSDSADEAVDRVVEAQRRVMCEFPDFSFDFSIMFQLGREIGEILAPATPIFQRA